jgi:fatty acid desaturase
MARQQLAGGPHPHGRRRIAEGHPHLAATGRGLAAAFWALAAGVIVAYVFFLSLGAFGSAEVSVLTAVVIVLAALWVVHALADARRRARDPRIKSERERRGF